MDWQADELLLDVQTPLGFPVHCTHGYWMRKVVAQHPVMATRVEDVKQALTIPDEVRLSRIDKHVYLFYRQDERRLVCVVARQTNGDGFLITAYPADKMKVGRVVWKK